MSSILDTGGDDEPGAVRYIVNGVEDAISNYAALGSCQASANR